MPPRLIWSPSVGRFIRSVFSPTQNAWFRRRRCRRRPLPAAVATRLDPAVASLHRARAEPALHALRRVARPEGPRSGARGDDDAGCRRPRRPSAPASAALRRPRSGEPAMPGSRSRWPTSRVRIRLPSRGQDRRAAQARFREIRSGRPIACCAGLRAVDPAGARPCRRAPRAHLRLGSRRRRRRRTYIHFMERPPMLACNAAGRSALRRRRTLPGHAPRHRGMRRGEAKMRARRVASTR